MGLSLLTTGLIGPMEAGTVVRESGSFLNSPSWQLPRIRARAAAASSRASSGR